MFRALLTTETTKRIQLHFVFITGCSNGLLPHSKNCNTNNKRRMFYVATTKAIKELYITCPHEYNNITIPASPFIEYIIGTVNLTHAGRTTGIENGKLENRITK
ncbi:MAG: ATP-dependent helicase [Lachnospiraceae bacterium]|nr:ATP-dependent helicase [Lachnospiraceae bacterium]